MVGGPAVTTTGYPEDPGYVAGSDTSLSAAQSVAGQPRDAMKARVRELLTAMETTGDLLGLTSDELEQITGWSHQSASARLREVVLDGFAYDSAERRLTRYGRKAVVRRVTPVATGFDGTPYPAGWTQDEIDGFEEAQERRRDYEAGR